PPPCAPPRATRRVRPAGPPCDPPPRHRAWEGRRSVRRGPPRAQGPRASLRSTRPKRAEEDEQGTYSRGGGGGRGKRRTRTSKKRRNRLKRGGPCRARSHGVGEGLGGGSAGSLQRQKRARAGRSDGCSARDEPAHVPAAAAPRQNFSPSNSGRENKTRPRPRIGRGACCQLRQVPVPTEALAGARSPPSDIRRGTGRAPDWPRGGISKRRRGGGGVGGGGGGGGGVGGGGRGRGGGPPQWTLAER
ncbi:unnamed protein product, partial [Prorocentrum cordatum]